MNMIVGKRQILLATLIVALTIAVYINYKFTGAGEDYLATNLLSEEEESYGAAQFVDNPVEGSLEAQPQDAASYFAQARLNRDQSRDEAISTLRTMLSDSSLETSQLESLTQEAADIALAIEAEGKMENLIKAKGFQECMVYCDGETVDVVVQSDGLLDSEVAQIRDVVLSETDVPVENISIVEVK